MIASRLIESVLDRHCSARCAGLSSSISHPVGHFVLTADDSPVSITGLF